MAEETVRCWLVERDYWDEDVVTLIYATPDGERYYQRQLSGALLGKLEITAATDLPPEDLERTPSAHRKRYAKEARRVQDENDPDDEL